MTSLFLYLLSPRTPIIEELSPVAAEEFAPRFNKQLAAFIPSADKKTLDNHRTEIVGKLFGMYYEENDVIYISERTQKFLADNDQPAFFKDMCFKFQFPNGLDKIQTLQDKLEHNVSVRPFCLIIKLVIDAYAKDIILNQNEVAYYAMNSLDALSGRATTDEIIDQIKTDRSAHITRRVSYQDKAESYNTQHVREQINYLELANLIRNKSGNLFPNTKEQKVLNTFADYTYDLGFDIGGYDLEDYEARSEFYRDWQVYYSSIAKDVTDELTTTVDALQYDVDETGKQVSKAYSVDTMQIGDDGEALVYKYEKDRVSEYDPRLTNKIHMLGKTKGLGYDIQSIFATERDDPEFVKYIEVKSTKRVTSPDKDKDDWIDTLNITRNEWVAAQQHGNSFEIYRVYFTQSGPEMFIIKNPYEKNEKNIIRTLPTMYRLDFNSHAIDKVVNFG